MNETDARHSDVVLKMVEKLAVTLNGHGIDPRTIGDALILGAVAAAVAARPPGEVAAELRKLADQVEASSGAFDDRKH